MKTTEQKKIFYENPYCKEFESRVISCQQGKGGYEVVLEQSAFYPEGGGQPGDWGWLADKKVLDTREKNGEVIHICDGPLEVGSLVKGILDWDRRFRHMQQHTGEHIFSGLVYKHFGYHNVGFHMGKDFVSVDFDGMLTPEQVLMIEEEANQAVFNNREVLADYPEKEALDKLSYRSKKELEGPVRIVEIPDADICACCGTHVAKSGEIGMIKVVSRENYKGGIRLLLQIGWSALEDYRKKTESVQKISTILSAKPELVAEAVEKLHQVSAEQKYQLIHLKKQLLEYKAKEIVSEKENLCVVTRDLDNTEIRVLCDMLLEKYGLVLTLSGTEAEGFKFVFGKKEGEIAEEGKLFRDGCNARGGGKGNMMQGSAVCREEELVSFVQKQWDMDILFL